MSFVWFFRDCMEKNSAKRGQETVMGGHSVWLFRDCMKKQWKKQDVERLFVWLFHGYGKTTITGAAEGHRRPFCKVVS